MTRTEQPGAPRWRPFDAHLEDRRLTYDTAPLTLREAVLDRLTGDPDPGARTGTLSMTPAAIAKRAERARRKLNGSGGG